MTDEEKKKGKEASQGDRVDPGDGDCLCNLVLIYRNRDPMPDPGRDRLSVSGLRYHALRGESAPRQGAGGL